MKIFQVCTLSLSLLGGMSIFILPMNLHNHHGGIISPTLQVWNVEAQRGEVICQKAHSQPRVWVDPQVSNSRGHMTDHYPHFSLYIKKKIQSFCFIKAYLQQGSGSLCPLLRTNSLNKATASSWGPAGAPSICRQRVIALLMGKTSPAGQPGLQAVSLPTI